MTRDRSTRGRLREIYDSLLDAYGPQGWWPAKSPFETMVGAVLTQNTAWTNAERALSNLRREDALSPDGMARLSERKLRRLIGPAGFCARKADVLLDLVAACSRLGGIDELLGAGQDSLRELLLNVRGIGPETADAVLLYAAGYPSFVVDAYTTRMAVRHELVDSRADYSAIKNLFERNLPRNTALFNEYHALLVRLAKDHCRAKPACLGCPIFWDLPGELF